MRPQSVIAFFLLLISLFIAGSDAENCGKALVAEIADGSISSSSVKDYSEAAHVKLDKEGWSPQNTDKHPWIKIDLGDLYLVCGFAVQGCSDNGVDTWVTRYRVQVSPEENFWDSWNYIKPEFYGGKSAKEVVYSKAKERKVGRYVKVYPVSYISKTNDDSACMKLEIYGEQYLSLKHKQVFMRASLFALTYKMMKIKTINHHIHEVDLVETNDGPSKKLRYYPNYAEVIPYYEPLQTELQVDSCVLAPSKGHFISGRVHANKEDRYLVEFLLYANKKGKDIQLHSFKREQLQVVFSAWCKKIDFFARTPTMCHGQIVRIDSRLVFKNNKGGALHHLSYQLKDRDPSDYVSRKEVKSKEVKAGKNKLWKEDFTGCLEKVTLVHKVDEWLNINKLRRNKVWYRKEKPETCTTGEINKNRCQYSRVPFTVVRQNCSVLKAWNGKKCSDEDECLTGMAACGLHAACKNTQGYYDCFCPNGFKGKNPRTEDCKDVDECTDKENKACPGNSICKNTIGSFTCLCKKGFKRDRYKGCVDIDECQVSANKQNCQKHKNAICNNYPGSFRCECKPGYHGNYKQCKDLDECISNKHKCSPHADCANTIGSYKCACKKGFFGNGRTCKDIKECKDPTVSRKCHSPHGQCVDTPGGYKCECKKGYYGDGINRCELANECELNIHTCHTWATCVNTLESYECHCNKGFEGDGHSCKDIDECALKEHNCGARRDGIECLNTNGSYKCICAKGYAGDGKKCVNIDECKLGTHDCVKDAICIDKMGTFICTCREDFYGDPRRECKPKTRCMKALPHCDVPRAICANKTKNGKMKFFCYCKSGFTGENSNCIDINECLTGKGTCSKDALCINTAGSYECRCKDGFVGDGFTCSDVNECTNKTRCPPNANCINTHGSSECRCKTGYHGDDPYKHCSDVDECDDYETCDGDGQECINTFGSYRCQCEKGFAMGPNNTSPVNITCEDIDECKTESKPCGRAHYLTCENTDGDYFCRCHHGFEFNRKLQICKDIDECTAGDYPCVDEATCINNDGDFDCACPEGYHGNGKYYCDVNSYSPKQAATFCTFMVAMVTSLLVLSSRRV